MNRRAFEWGVLGILVAVGAAADEIYVTMELNVPGAQYTYARGIDGSNVVGSYVDGSGVGHGFLFDGSDYTTLDVPGAIGTSAYGVDNGNVVGSYSIDASYNAHGFLFDGTDYTTLDVPGMIETDAYGIDDGRVVLVSWLMGGAESFLYDGSDYTSLVPPGAADDEASVSDIDGTNIVGFFADNMMYKTHGFLYDGADYTVLDVAGARDTLIYGIDGDTLIGYYLDASWGSHNACVFSMTQAVPEPSTFVMLPAVGLAVLGCLWRRRRASR